MPPKWRKRKAPKSSGSVKRTRTDIGSESNVGDKYVRQQAEEFLENLQIPTTKPPSENAVLQLLVTVIILSARISKSIGTKSFILLKDEFGDLDKLSAASWDQLCDVTGFAIALFYLGSDPRRI